MSDQVEDMGVGQAIVADSKWTKRLSGWTLKLGVFALVLTLGGAILARFDIIPKLMGLNGMLGGSAVAGLGTLIGVIALILNLFNRPGAMKAALIGLLLSGGHFGFMASRAVVASKVPSIHDITTDLQDPPQFAKIKLAADNLRGVGTVEKWRELHAGSYSNLLPIPIAKPVAQVIADAEKLAKSNGWEVAVADPATGRLEATASVSLIGFKDDVVLRVRPTEDGKGSIVDMRSVSRVGLSDLGVNAKRITAFLAALSKA